MHPGAQESYEMRLGSVGAQTSERSQRFRSSLAGCYLTYSFSRRVLSSPLKRDRVNRDFRHVSARSYISARRSIEKSTVARFSREKLCETLRPFFRGGKTGRGAYSILRQNNHHALKKAALTATGPHMGPHLGSSYNAPPNDVKHLRAELEKMH